jgi:hypothetical protein
MAVTVTYADLNGIYIPADTPAAGPDQLYFAQVAVNFAELTSANGAAISGTGAGTAITSSATVKVSLPTVDLDTTGTLFTSVADRITIPAALPGLYEIRASLGLTSGSVGPSASVQAKVRKNNTTDLANGLGVGDAFSAIYATCSGTFTAQLVAGDYLELWVVTSANASGCILHDESGIHLSVLWLHS